MEFEEVYTRFSPGIFRVCMGYVNDHDEAKDLVQETFIAVWKNLSSFRGEANISTWIYRIATNNCLRHIERSKRKRTEPLPVQHADSIEHSKEEKLNYLYQCISELEETDRIIISLVLEELPQAEIATIVGLSEVNIRVRVHRIKDKLSKKFKQHGEFE